MDLSTKTREELVEIAKNLKISVHHKAKPETIINQINQQQDSLKAAAVAKSEEVVDNDAHYHTEDEIRTALKSFLDKDGAEIRFHKDKSFTVEYRKASECFNMSVPLRVLSMKVMSGVARGSISPRALQKGDGQYKGYADNILSA